jgi:hypothetical protein
MFESGILQKNHESREPAGGFVKNGISSDAKVSSQRFPNGFV